MASSLKWYINIDTQTGGDSVTMTLMRVTEPENIPMIEKSKVFKSASEAMDWLSDAAVDYSPRALMIDNEIIMKAAEKEEEE